MCKLKELGCGDDKIDLTENLKFVLSMIKTYWENAGNQLLSSSEHNML